MEETPDATNGVELQSDDLGNSIKHRQARYRHSRKPWDAAAD
jgi:hypothetical protein